MTNYLTQAFCAVADCPNFLRWRGLEHETDTLRLNSWVLDHDKWICPHHEPGHKGRFFSPETPP